MAYVYTGTERSLTFTLTKTVGGETVIGYPKTYDGKLAFPGYSALTDEQARRLTDSQYTTRLAAFHSYVESLESGFDSDTDFTNSSTATDLVNCPPPATTTTTVAGTTTTTEVGMTTTTTL